MKRLLPEGGGLTNGKRLRAGLVDGVRLIVCPFAAGAPTLLRRRPFRREADDAPAPVRRSGGPDEGVAADHLVRLVPVDEGAVGLGSREAGLIEHVPLDVPPEYWPERG